MFSHQVLHLHIIIFDVFILFIFRFLLTRNFWNSLISLSYSFTLFSINWHLFNQLDPISLTSLQGYLPDFLSVTCCSLSQAVLLRTLYQALKTKINQRLLQPFLILTALFFILLHPFIIEGRFTQLRFSSLTFFIFFNGFILFISFCTVIFNYLVNREELHRKDRERELIATYTAAIEESYTSLRYLRHDYNNLCLALQQYIVDEDYKGLEHYLRENLSEQADRPSITSATFDQLAMIKNPAIKGLLMAKVNSLESLSYKYQLEVQSPITEIPMSTVDLVRILGIFIDNAIEERQELASGTIRILTYRLSRSIHFIIENPCRSKDKSYRQLKQQGVSSKGSERGLGLTIIHRILEKYENVSLETLNKDASFVQHLMIVEN
ncbi:GHKL domain-containing protein [Aerococcus sp. UMB7834]|uniref:sensor histidine kinase n=1 Tax=Aerococcus sp. UMB7834 TaxID=3046342 RepID=UPI00254B370A|nr:GHKL domain-containing protein [Aerococcus sp. UMB7834]MDK6805693.1 GHKL domain-containing protein [Aerococcus sp. UMB7834]